ncbi:hypothetical protein GF337_16600, partial [candidate division KSB1 bacterium]|nr:hypothetical protein [candidate division KSB1 bacterium]
MLSGKTFSPVLLLACLFLFLISMILVTYVKHYTEDRIIDWLDHQINNTLIYDKISIQFPGEMQIHNLRTKDALNEQENGFYIRLLKIHIKLKSLFRKELDFSYIRVEGMRVTIACDRQTDWKMKLLENVLKSVVDSTAMPIVADRFSLIDGDITIGDSKLPQEINCSNFSLFVRHSWQEQKLEGRFAMKSAVVVISNEKQFFDKIQSAFYIKNGTINLSTSASYFRRSLVEANLKIDLADEFAISGRIMAKANLLELSGHYSIPDSMLTGTPAIQYSFEGKLNDFALKGDLEIDRIQISNIPIHEIRATFELNKSGWFISKLQGDAAGGLLFGDVQYHRDARTAIVNYKLRNAELEQTLKLFQIDSKGFSGNLECDGYFNVLSPGFELRSISADCRFSNMAYNKRVVPESRLMLKLKNNRVLAMYSMQSVEMGIDGEIVDNIWQNTNLTCSIPNMQTIGFLFRDQKIGGEFRVAAKIDGKFRNPALNGRFDLLAFQYDGAAIDSMNGMFLVEKGQLTIKQSSFTGEIIDFAKFKSIFDLNGLSGRLKFSGSLTGELKNPAISIDTRWDSCGISDFRFDSLKSHIKYQEKQVSKCTVVAFNHNFPLYIDYESADKKLQRPDCIISPDSYILNPEGKSTFSNCIYISGDLPSSSSKLHIKELHFSDFLKFYTGNEKISGLINGEGELRNLFKNPEIALKLNITDFCSDFLQIKRIESVIECRDQSFEIDNLQNKYSKQQILPAILDLRAKGYLKHPEFSIDWQITDLNLHNFQTSSFNGSLSYADSMLESKGVSLKLAGNTMKMNGSIPMA